MSQVATAQAATAQAGHQRRSSITGFRVCFILWGILGFLIASLSIFSMISSASVGVGTSAYVAAGMLYLIGGMVFFGIGDLLQKV
jgi:uncharacterized membrane protein